MKLSKTDTAHFDEKVEKLKKISNGISIKGERR